MKSFAILLMFIGMHYCFAQDSLVSFSPEAFELNYEVSLSGLDGWLFKEGNDTLWAKKDINTKDWRKLKPTEISAKFADKNGKVEGWFRFRFRLDNNFGIPIGVRRGGWAATDVYVDGNLLSAFGNTGTNGKGFQEYNPIDKLSVTVNLEPGKEHLIAIHFVDYLSSFPPHHLKSETDGGSRFVTMGLKHFLALTGPQYDSFTLDNSKKTLFYRSIWTSVTVLLAFLFWLLFFQNQNEKKTLLLIAVYSSFSALSNLTRFYITDPSISFDVFWLSDLLGKLSSWMMVIVTFIITATILNFRLYRNFIILSFAYSFLGALTIFFNFFIQFLSINVVIEFLGVTYILISSWKKLKGAQWAIASGVLLSILFGTLLVTIGAPGSTKMLFLLTCFYFSFPLSLLVYISMRFREILNEVNENARQVVEMSEEKKLQALNQQKLLQEEVIRQTAELRNTLDDLRSTQSQLIQSEKMASLGELTAGIAHEIQNPLNFVNNFSEVNEELLSELKGELSKGKMDDAIALANDAIENQKKINHHGKRADAIVKGMLQHSRASSGIKESTDINALCDEYLRLSYHGLRAKDKSFNAKFETNFDQTLGKINVIPQDIGRVILNLINNAFYAVAEKEKKLGRENYEPTVTVSTKKSKVRPEDLVGRARPDDPFGHGKIQIIIKDNGNGIPDSVKDKIFQPFFTTKPTGEGTGLGLSLSYDIVKAHGGEIKMVTIQGGGTDFVINLPDGKGC